MLILVEHEKCFITSRLGLVTIQAYKIIVGIMQHLKEISALLRLTGTILHLQVHVEGKFMTVLSIQWHFYVCTVNLLGKVN